MDPRRLSAGDWVRVLAPLLIYVVLALLAWRLGYFKREHTHAIAEKAAQASDGGGFPWFAVLFVLVYGAVAAAALPVAPLAYGAGAVFGFWEATTLIFIASLLGASLGYLLARTIWSGTAERLLGPYRDRLSRMRGGNVVLTALRMQLLPFIPFGVFNYAAAIGGLAFLQFLAGTAIGIVPGTLAAAAIGDRVIAGFSGGGGRAFEVAGALIAAVVLLSFVPAIVRRKGRRATSR